MKVPPVDTSDVLSVEPDSFHELLSTLVALLPLSKSQEHVFALIDGLSSGFTADLPTFESCATDIRNALPELLELVRLMETGGVTDRLRALLALQRLQRQVWKPVLQKCTPHANTEHADVLWAFNLLAFATESPGPFGFSVLQSSLGNLPELYKHLRLSFELLLTPGPDGEVSVVDCELGGASLGRAAFLLLKDVEAPYHLPSPSSTSAEVAGLPEGGLKDLARGALHGFLADHGMLEACLVASATLPGQVAGVLGRIVHSASPQERRAALSELSNLFAVTVPAALDVCDASQADKDKLLRVLERLAPPNNALDVILRNILTHGAEVYDAAGEVSAAVRKEQFRVAGEKIGALLRTAVLSADASALSEAFEVKEIEERVLDAGSWEADAHVADSDALPDEEDDDSTSDDDGDEEDDDDEVDDEALLRNLLTGASVFSAGLLGFAMGRSSGRRSAVNRI